MGSLNVRLRAAWGDFHRWLRRFVQVGKITRLCGVYIGACCAWMLLFRKSPDEALLTNLLTLPVSLLAALLPFVAASRHAGERSVRHAWLLLGATFVLQFLGDLSWAYVENVLGEDPTSTWVNLPYLLYYPLLLSALFHLPRFHFSRSEMGRLLLDCATVVVSGGLVIWHFLLGPELTHHPRNLSDLLPLAYPVGDILTLLGLAWILLHRRVDPERRVLDYLALGILANLGGNLLYAIDATAFDHRTGGPVDALWLVSYLMTIAAAERGALLPRLEEVRFVDRHASSISLVPYVAIGLGYSLVILVAFRGEDESMRGLTLGAFLLTMIVVARQVVVVRDNLRLQGTRASQTSEARFRSLVQNSSDVIMIVDREGAIWYASPSSLRVCGYPPEELLGRRITEFLAPDDVPRAAAFLARSALLPKGSTVDMAWRFHRADGVWIHAENLATNLLEEPGVHGLVLNTRDVSERRALEGQLYHQAFHDSLTGLPNRTLFSDRVNHALARGERGKAPVAVLFIDLDNFKEVNDSLGHARGDGLLREAAQRLRDCLRTADTAARLGGDEFGVLMEDLAEISGVVNVADRIIEAFRAPFVLDDRELLVTVSVGIARESAGDSAEVLLRNADVAMYFAKSRGRSCYQFFEPSMHTAAMEQLEMQTDLRRAVSQNAFSLCYQPIIAMDSGRTLGIEALLRWNHGTKGAVPPGLIVQAAERTGLMIPIGRWVLREALSSAREWQSAGRPGLWVTVNLSPRQLQAPGLVEDVRQALEITGCAPDRLVLELTEGALLEETENVLATLRGLRALGVRLAIDDFGTGYSSLSYLSRFPIDILKVAKHFVDGIQAGKETPPLVRAVVHIGQSLGLSTIAEGIETAHQASELRRLGCEMGQGYHFARPMAKEQVASHLERAEQVRETAPTA